MTSRILRRIKKINLKLGVVFLVIVVLIYLAEPQLPYFIGGLALVILGELIRIWATGHLEKNISLTTSGPYAYIKNPMYVGTFLIMLGFDALAINPYIHYIIFIQLLGFLFYYAPYKRRVEGARLLNKFGPAYADYDKNVPDYIPKCFKPYEGVHKPWSIIIFKGNNELDIILMAILGVIAVASRFWI